MKAMGKETIPAGAAQAVQRANAVTGECPYWDSESGFLWWVDIQGQRALGYAPSSGEERIFELPGLPGLLVGRRKGGMLIGLEDGIHEFDPVAGLGARLVEVEADKPLSRLNDGKPDAAGRLWFGTMDKTGMFAPVGALYRLDPDLSLHRSRENVRIPNSIAFSPDGTRMYFADSATHTVEVMPYDSATGTPGTSEVFVRYPADIVPDGATIDSEGALWIALVGGGKIERRLPDGTLDLTVQLPVSRPTMPALGGADGSTLFVTSQRRLLSRDGLAREKLAGDLLAVRVPHAAAAPFEAGM
jgi:L-arabinonolactonase